MGRWRRTTACERAAQWISLELDDELGELDGAALDRHLGRCERCSDARAEIAGFTLALREAPALARTAPVAVAWPRARRAKIVRRTAATLVLAAALGAAGGVVVLPQSAPDQSSDALGSATLKQRLEFARAEHVRVEQETLAPAPSPVLPATFALRALN